MLIFLIFWLWVVGSIISSVGCSFFFFSFFTLSLSFFSFSILWCSHNGSTRGVSQNLTNPKYILPYAWTYYLNMAISGEKNPPNLAIFSMAFFAQRSFEWVSCNAFFWGGGRSPTDKISPKKSLIDQLLRNGGCQQGKVIHNHLGESENLLSTWAKTLPNWDLFCRLFSISPLCTRYSSNQVLLWWKSKIVP